MSNHGRRDRTSTFSISSTYVTFFVLGIQARMAIIDSRTRHLSPFAGYNSIDTSFHAEIGEGVYYTIRVLIILYVYYTIGVT